MSRLPTSRRRSILWTIAPDKLQRILDQSSSIKEVLNYFGLQGATGGNRGTLSKRIQEDNLDLSQLYKNRDAKKWRQHAPITPYAHSGQRRIECPLCLNL